MTRPGCLAGLLLCLVAVSAVQQLGPWQACEGAALDLPFCNESLPADERVRDLSLRITLDEAAGQLTARESAAVDRLGLPGYYWGTNALHGVQDVPCLDKRCATSFPAPCALAASFNMRNVERMGEVIGTELRAFFNERAHNSLDTWSPTINLARDPRWGRTVESCGEDPMLCGLFGSAYTRGLQQEGKDLYLQAAVTLKHWVAYNVENYNGSTRHDFDSKLSDWELVETFLPAWERAVRGERARGVMCSYNKLNGIPTCGHPRLTAVLREKWNFSGYITSDTDACHDIWRTHGYVNSPEEAVAACLKGGTDINSGTLYMGHLVEAVNRSLVSAADVQQALAHTYRVRLELGLFDAEGSKKSKYASIMGDVIGQPSHQAASLQAAREGLVLLKNSGGVLPVRKGQRIAVIGSSADSVGDMMGNYNGVVCPGGKYSCFPSIFKEILARNAAAGGSTTLAAGPSVSEAVAVARAADFVVLVASNAHDGGGESHDRTTIGLQARQADVMHAVLALGKPCVLVLLNGGIIAIDGLRDEAPAILEAFMPGVHGGTALAEVIFGDYNPGGRLPVTIYSSKFVDEVDFLNMSLLAGRGRTYKYYTGEPLFPFGFGLSYSSFAFRDTSLPPNISSDGSAVFKAAVENTGGPDGDVVVLLYVRRTPMPDLGVPLPQRRLVAFQRIGVAASAVSVAEILLTAEDLALVDTRGDKTVFPGIYELEATLGNGGSDIVRRLEITGPRRVLFSLGPLASSSQGPAAASSPAASAVQLQV